MCSSWGYVVYGTRPLPSVIKCKLTNINWLLCLMDIKLVKRFGNSCLSCTKIIDNNYYAHDGSLSHYFVCDTMTTVLLTTETGKYSLLFLYSYFA